METQEPYITGNEQSTITNSEIASFIRSCNDLERIISLPNLVMGEEVRLELISLLERCISKLSGENKSEVIRLNDS